MPLLEVSDLSVRFRTDRGPVQFLLGDSDDIRRLGPHRAILLDVHGGRYYIADSRQLDPRSQQILARYL